MRWRWLILQIFSVKGGRYYLQNPQNSFPSEKNPQNNIWNLPYHWNVLFSIPIWAMGNGHCPLGAGEGRVVKACPDGLEHFFLRIQMGNFLFQGSTLESSASVWQRCWEPSKGPESRARTVYVKLESNNELERVRARERQREIEGESQRAIVSQREIGREPERDGGERANKSQREPVGARGSQSELETTRKSHSEPEWVKESLQAAPMRGRLTQKRDNWKKDWLKMLA